MGWFLEFQCGVSSVQFQGVFTEVQESMRGLLYSTIHTKPLGEDQPTNEAQTEGCLV